MPDPDSRPYSYYVWEPPNRLVTILLNLCLLDRLKPWMDQGLHEGEEVGGILLGRIEESASGEVVVTIEDCETVAIDHQRGPSYTLNDKDKRQIKKRVSFWQTAGQSRTAVGLARSHVRSGLYLDAADFAVFQNYFPGPRSVFLVARPGADATAGFFFWEDGDIHRQAAYLSFPFDREKLETGAHTILRSPGHPAAKTVSLPVRIPVNQPPASTPKRWDVSKLRQPGLPWLAAAAIVLLLMAGGLYWERSRSAAFTTASAGFGLNIDHLGRALRLTWDTRIPVIKHARQANLWVRDGGSERRLVLNAAQIEHGSALYVPASNDVEFRLQLRAGGNEIADSIRSVAPGLKPIPASNTQAMAASEANETQPAESADRTTPVQPAKPAPAAEKKQLPALAARARKRSGDSERDRPASITTEASNRNEPAAQMSRPPPAEIAKAEPAPAPEPPPVEPPARPVRRSVPTVSVNFEAVPESPLRRTIQKVPGLRLLQHYNYRGGDNFAPARPLHEVRPQLRMTVVRALPGEWRVQLKVSLDKHGRVSDVESLSTEADQRLVVAAVSAIRESLFEPAQLNGRGVSSRLLVTYHFRNPPQMTAVARTSP